MQALINKETLSAICTTKGVSAAYIAQHTGFTLNKVERWLNPQE